MRTRSTSLYESFKENEIIECVCRQVLHVAAIGLQRAGPKIALLFTSATNLASVNVPWLPNGGLLMVLSMWKRNLHDRLHLGLCWPWSISGSQCSFCIARETVDKSLGDVCVRFLWVSCFVLNSPKRTSLWMLFGRRIPWKNTQHTCTWLTRWGQPPSLSPWRRNVVYPPSAKRGSVSCIDKAFV